MDLCPICNNNYIIYKRRENIYICTKCGYVRHGVGIYSHAPPYPKVEEHNKVSTHTYTITNNNIQLEYITPEEKYLNIISKEFEDMTRFIPTIRKVDIQTAETMLKMYIHTTNRKIKKRRRELAVALILLSTKLNGTHPISRKKLATLITEYKLSIRYIKKFYRDIVRSLRIRIPTRSEDEERIVLTKIRRKYGFNENINTLIKNLYSTIQEKRVGIGKSKTTLIASIAYIAYKIYEYNVNQRGIAQTAGITEVPLRNMIKEILSNINIEILV